MYIELRTDYQGLIFSMAVVVYRRHGYLLHSSVLICVKKLHNFQEFGHQPPDWLREIASSSGIEFIFPLLSVSLMAEYVY